MNYKIFASKISGQFASESGGQFNRYLQYRSIIVKKGTYQVNPNEGDYGSVIVSVRSH